MSTRDEIRAERDAEIVAWLVKKAREFRKVGTKASKAQGDTVAAMASKIQRGAVRPNNTLMWPATQVTEPDWHALLLAAVKSFRSTARAEGGWSEQLAQHLLDHLGSLLGPVADVARVVAEYEQLAATAPTEDIAKQWRLEAATVRNIARSLNPQDGAES